MTFVSPDEVSFVFEEGAAVVVLAPEASPLSSARCAMSVRKAYWTMG